MDRLRHLPALLGAAALCLALQSCQSNTKPELKAKVETQAQLGARVKALNNQAIRELFELQKTGAGVSADILVKDKARIDKWRHAIATQEASVLLWPYRYKIGEGNLAVLLNNHALELANGSKLQEALTECEHAVFLDKTNEITISNLNLAIQNLGKKTNKLEDRIALGDAAAARNDSVGALVEYNAAIALKDNIDLREKIERAKIAILKGKNAVFKKVQADRT